MHGQGGKVRMNGVVGRSTKIRRLDKHARHQLRVFKAGAYTTFDLIKQQVGSDYNWQPVDITVI